MANRKSGEFHNIHQLLKVDKVDRLLNLPSQPNEFFPPKRHSKLQEIIHTLKVETYKNINDLEYRLAFHLGCDVENLTERITGNIQSYICFKDLIDYLQKRKKKESYISILGDGLRSVGGVVRGNKASSKKELRKSRFSSFREMREQYEKVKKRYIGIGKVSGNILRNMGEKFSGESTNLLRIIKRTIEGKNPFRKDLSDEKRKIKKDEESQKKVLVAIVHSLLQNFKGNDLRDDDKELKSNSSSNSINYSGNPAILFIEYLFQYGFYQFGNRRHGKCYFDGIWYTGLSKYVFHLKEYKNEEEFIQNSFQFSRKWIDVFDYHEIEFNAENITYKEAKFIKEEYAKDRKDYGIRLHDIRKLKENILRREEMERIFAKVYRQELITLEEEKKYTEHFEILGKGSELHKYNEEIKENLKEKGRKDLEKIIKRRVSKEYENSGEPLVVNLLDNESIKMNDDPLKKRIVENKEEEKKNRKIENRNNEKRMSEKKDSKDGIKKMEEKLDIRLSSLEELENQKKKLKELHKINDEELNNFLNKDLSTSFLNLDHITVGSSILDGNVVEKKEEEIEIEKEEEEEEPKVTNIENNVKDEKKNDNNNNRINRINENNNDENPFNEDDKVEELKEGFDFSTTPNNSEFDEFDDDSSPKKKGEEDDDEKEETKKGGEKRDKKKGNEEDNELFSMSYNEKIDFLMNDENEN